VGYISGEGSYLLFPAVPRPTVGPPCNRHHRSFLQR